jgi:hypothetical protein
MPNPINLPQADPAETVEGPLALEELKAFQAGINLDDRKALKAFNDLDRSDKFEHHIYRITVIGVYVGGVVGIALLLTVVLHKAGPTTWRFLTPDQLKDAYDFLVTAVISFAAGAGKKYLKA